MVTQKDISCYLCGNTEHLIRPGVVRDNKNLQILECQVQAHYLTQGLIIIKDIDALLTEHKFDLIRAFHVIEHLEDPADVLRKLSTHLQPGGHQNSPEISAAYSASLAKLGHTDTLIAEFSHKN